MDNSCQRTEILQKTSIISSPFGRNKAITHLVDIDCRVIQRIHKHVHEVAGGRIPTRSRSLSPGVSAGKAIPWRKDELLCACAADAVDGSLGIKRLSRILLRRALWDIYLPGHFLRSSLLAKGDECFEPC